MNSESTTGAVEHPCSDRLSGSLNPDELETNDSKVSCNGCEVLESKDDESPSKNLEKEEKLGGPMFDPPLYKQRYEEVSRILTSENVVTVADFGTSEGKIIRYLRRIPSVQEIHAVDIDADVIKDAIYLCRAQLHDFINRHPVPVTIHLWEGDVTKCDSTFYNLDAITMVEVIEHLEADVLSALPENLFHNLRPRLILLTTPNAEFNVLFPGFSGFRHWDHKFEWTRAEFQAWCTTQAEKYGYSVVFSGVGDPPPERSDVGHCSQTALFTRLHNAEEKLEKIQDSSEPYKLIHKSALPFSLPESIEKQILYEAQYYVHRIATELQRKYEEEWEEEENDGEDKEEKQEDEIKYLPNESAALVSLKRLMLHKSISSLCSIEQLSLEQLRDVLLTAPNLEVSADKKYVKYQLPSELSMLPNDLDLCDEDYENEDKVEGDDYADNAEDNDTCIWGDFAKEQWGSDDGSAYDYKPTDKPWNNPANWNLPLEVTNPDLAANLVRRGGGNDAYLQGFHRGAISCKKPISQIFRDAYNYRIITTQSGQFDDYVPLSNKCNDDSELRNINSKPDELTQKLEQLESLSNLVLNDSGDSDTGMGSSGVDKTLDTVANKGEESVDCSVSPEEEVFSYTPCEERTGPVHLDSWKELEFKVEEDQFVLD